MIDEAIFKFEFYSQCFRRGFSEHVFSEICDTYLSDINKGKNRKRSFDFHLALNSKKDASIFFERNEKRLSKLSVVDYIFKIGMSISELADEFKVTERTIYNWQSGESIPSHVVFMHLENLALNKKGAV